MKLGFLNFFSNRQSQNTASSGEGLGADHSLDLVAPELVEHVNDLFCPEEFGGAGAVEEDAAQGNWLAEMTADAPETGNAPSLQSTKQAAEEPVSYDLTAAPLVEHVNDFLFSLEGYGGY